MSLDHFSGIMNKTLDHFHFTIVQLIKIIIHITVIGKHKLFMSVKSFPSFISKVKEDRLFVFGVYSFKNISLCFQLFNRFRNYGTSYSKIPGDFRDKRSGETPDIKNNMDFTSEKSDSVPKIDIVIFPMGNEFNKLIKFGHYRFFIFHSFILRRKGCFDK